MAVRLSKVFGGSALALPARPGGRWQILGGRWLELRAIYTSSPPAGVPVPPADSMELEIKHYALTEIGKVRIGSYILSRVNLAQKVLIFSSVMKFCGKFLADPSTDLDNHKESP